MALSILSFVCAVLIVIALRAIPWVWLRSLVAILVGLVAGGALIAVLAYSDIVEVFGINGFFSSYRTDSSIVIISAILILSPILALVVVNLRRQ